MGPLVTELGDDELGCLMGALKYQNHYEVVKTLTDRLGLIKDYIGCYLKVEEFYRARIGVAKECTYSPDVDYIPDTDEFIETYLLYKGRSIGPHHLRHVMKVE